MSKQKLDDLVATLEAAVKHKRERRIDFFEPYEKQWAFLNAGAQFRERLLMAGNQLGKSETGAYETALHLTGEYPAGWKGKRFDHPVRVWAAGVSSVLVRDVQQTKLCGPPGVDSELGTGFIPRAAFVDKPSLARGVTDAFDTISVRHISGGTSTLTFKSFEQGREKFQGEPVHVVWLDEEAPEDVYSECLTRTVATGGIVYCTFTPLKGRTPVVQKFMSEPTPFRFFVTMTMMDAGHMTPEKREAALAGYPAHEREARANGVPMLGSGRIFNTSEETLREPLLYEVPKHWAKLWGVDFGIAHSFAAVLMAWDKDADVIHLLHAIRVKDQQPLQHSAAMKPIGEGVPVAWPQDGTQRDKGSGIQLASQYRAHGLRMLPGPAMWPDGGNSTEAGILEMDERMQTGRFKVASHLSDWFEEYRMYHRDKGQIVKVNDDLLSATRIAVMAKRFSQPVQLGIGKARRRAGEIARDVDFDVFEA